MSELLTPGNTIAAIATAIIPQQGSVGIVRMSGSEAMKIAKTLIILLDLDLIGLLICIREEIIFNIAGLAF